MPFKTNDLHKKVTNKGTKHSSEKNDQMQAMLERIKKVKKIKEKVDKGHKTQKLLQAKSDEFQKIGNNSFEVYNLNSIRNSYSYIINFRT